MIKPHETNSRVDGSKFLQSYAIDSFLSLGESCIGLFNCDNRCENCPFINWNIKCCIEELNWGEDQSVIRSDVMLSLRDVLTCLIKSYLRHEQGWINKIVNSICLIQSNSAKFILSWLDVDWMRKRMMIWNQCLSGIWLQLW